MPLVVYKFPAPKEIDHIICRSSPLSQGRTQFCLGSKSHQLQVVEIILRVSPGKTIGHLSIGGCKNMGNPKTVPGNTDIQRVDLGRRSKAREKEEYEQSSHLEN